MIQIKVKKLHPDAKLPTRMTDGAAGFDLYCLDIDTIIGEETGDYHYDGSACKISYTKISTGVSVEIPKGYVGYIYLRGSSVKFGRVLGGMVGVIDSDYRGELIINLLDGLDPNPGDRIAQLVIHKLPDVEMVEVDELSTTDRGEGGFGSTGQ